MKKTDISAAMRAHVHAHLTPTADERDRVAKIYSSVRDVLGTSKCLQVGSFARFTAVRSSHDLDILYVIGTWNAAVDPSGALGEVHKKLENAYRNPTSYRIAITQQTHSVSISFLNGANEEVFSVDVVPACSFDRNEFGDDTYMVPELIRERHAARKVVYEQLRKSARAMRWIKSDPRGYISVAASINNTNDDFRRSVKLVKGWRAAHKETNDRFPLKAFHAEQIITDLFKQNPRLEIFDAVFTFFCVLPAKLRKPCIPDRADSTVFIDQYLCDLTVADLQLVLDARDHFLIKLESITATVDVGALLTARPLRRRAASEHFLFDNQIPVLTEEPLRISGKALARQGSFREKVLDSLGLIDIDRRIEFRLAGNPPQADVFKWKVKNDDSSPEPRGEITDHRTRNDPEHTKYDGSHFVECYAIRGGACVARARQNVVLGRRF